MSSTGASGERSAEAARAGRVGKRTCGRSSTDGGGEAMAAVGGGSDAGGSAALGDDEEEPQPAATSAAGRMSARRRSTGVTLGDVRPPPRLDLEKRGAGH